jgi:hypothetical protein
MDISGVMWLYYTATFGNAAKFTFMASLMTGIVSGSYRT